MKKLLLTVSVFVILLLSSCKESTINGKELENYSNVGVVKIIHITGSDYNYFVVTIKDVNKNEIKINTHTLTYNVGDSVHVDSATKTIYPLKDKENLATFK
jgi:phage-related protein